MCWRGLARTLPAGAAGPVTRSTTPRVTRVPVVIPTARWWWQALHRPAWQPACSHGDRGHSMAYRHPRRGKGDWEVLRDPRVRKDGCTPKPPSVGLWQHLLRHRAEEGPREARMGVRGDSPLWDCVGSGGGRTEPRGCRITPPSVICPCAGDTASTGAALPLCWCSPTEGSSHL